jgi:hypothetical protein
LLLRPTLPPQLLSLLLRLLLLLLRLLPLLPQVAEGHREPLPKPWPDALKELVSSCWHEDPHMRPRISDVVAALHQLEATPGICDALDNIVVYPPEYHQPSCSCVIC